MKRKILFFSTLEIIAFCFAFLATFNILNLLDPDRYLLLLEAQEVSLFKIYEVEFTWIFVILGWSSVLLAEIVRRRLKKSLDRGRE